MFIDMVKESRNKAKKGVDVRTDHNPLIPHLNVRSAVLQNRTSSFTGGVLRNENNQEA
jgi:hypothetical protein